MAELKLVVFDVDGTLIDSLAHIKGAMTSAFIACDVPPPTEAAVRQIIGLSLPRVMQELHPSGTPAAQHALVEAYKRSFMETRDAQTMEQSAPLFPGARAALDRLARQDHVLLGVATGKSRRGLDKMIETHRLEGVFVTRQVADDHPSKPHPSMLEQTLRDTGVSKADAVMIGDTTFDMEMGRAAGFATIGVDWGYHATDALRPNTDHLIADFAQLDTALMQIWGPR